MDSNKLLGLLILAVFFMITTLITSTESCMCQPAHPQTSYCNADYAVIARVLRKSVKSSPQHHTYKIDIKKNFKMSEKAKYYLKEGRIITPKYDSMCGITLQPGKLYVIAGRGPQLTLCDYVKEYKHMTIVERRGFSGFYRKGCACKITPCFNNNPNCEESKNSCNWAPFGKCETELSMCVPRGRMNKCHWRINSAYKACISEP